MSGKDLALLGIIVGLFVLILVIRFVINYLVNKGSDKIENAVRSHKKKKQDEQGYQSENLADRFGGNNNNNNNNNNYIQ